MISFSLFKKPKSAKKFGYQPRYYKEQTERSEEHENRIIREIMLEKSEIIEYPLDRRMRMHRAFQVARRGDDSKQNTSGSLLNTNLIRMIIILLLILLFFGYTNWGSKVFYSLLILIPIYVYSKIANKAA